MKFSCHVKLYKRHWLAVLKTITPNGPVVWGVAVCVGVGMCFCTVPIDVQDFRVTIKLSRWLSPGKLAGFVTSG
jgi:hypothetical protein